MHDDVVIAELNVAPVKRKLKTIFSTQGINEIKHLVDFVAHLAKIPLQGAGHPVTVVATRELTPGHAEDYWRPNGITSETICIDL